ncbi:MAG: TraB/GumN family protein [Pseudomonadota bacterium]
MTARLRPLLLTAALLLGACGTANDVAPVAADATAPTAGQHFLWVLERDNSATYFLGSVHALRADDYPLPEALTAAYENADTLTMELPVNDLDPVAMAATTRRLGFLPAGDSLRDWLTPGDYASAAAKGAALGIDLARFDALEPWLAALTILNVQMMQTGFTPDAGIEAHFGALARGDGKAVEGLETLEEQLGIFDSLSHAEQVRLLLNTLDDVSDLDAGMQTLVDAWRSGDEAALEAELTAGFEGLPGMYQALVVDRNLRWLEPIEALAGTPGSHLVIVGAMHLIGSDSVIALLRDRGYRLRRL